MNLGFIGLGAMGELIVPRLMAAGHKVTGWNRTSHEWWGVQEEEAVGHDLYSLDFGLPVESLREPLSRVLAGESARETLELDATNRRGRPIRVHVRASALRDGHGRTAGAVLIIETGDGGETGSR